MTKKINNPKGFTLVELLIVVAVIGVLSAITSPQIGKMIDRSRSQAFARGIANQYRLARNQAQSTNQAFLVRIYSSASAITDRGLVEVWAPPNSPTNCRALHSIPSPAVPILFAGTERISFFEGTTIGGDMAIRLNSNQGNTVSIVCVQPNGEFLEVGGQQLGIFNTSASTKMCLGESMVIPIWRKPDQSFSLFSCAKLTTGAVVETRDQYDYWRISLWDNGQVTASRK